MEFSTYDDKIEFVEFLDVKINTVGYCDVRKVMQEAAASGQKGYICLTDVGNVISATKDEQLQNAINTSLLSLPDGAPLALFARLAGYKKTERISGARLMELLFTETEGFSHYLLGDTDQTINQVIDKAREISSEIKITGYSPPFKSFTQLSQ